MTIKIASVATTIYSLRYNSKPVLACFLWRVLSVPPGYLVHWSLPRHIHFHFPTIRPIFRLHHLCTSIQPSNSAVITFTNHSPSSQSPFEMSEFNSIAHPPTQGKGFAWLYNEQFEYDNPEFYNETTTLTTLDRRRQRLNVNLRARGQPELPPLKKRLWSAELQKECRDHRAKVDLYAKRIDGGKERTETKEMVKNRKRCAGFEEADKNGEEYVEGDEEDVFELKRMEPAAKRVNRDIFDGELLETSSASNPENAFHNLEGGSRRLKNSPISKPSGLMVPSKSSLLINNVVGSNQQQVEHTHNILPEATARQSTTALTELLTTANRALLIETSGTMKVITYILSLSLMPNFH